MSFANAKPQGKRQEPGHLKQNQGRGGKKWNTNNHTMNGGRAHYGSSPQSSPASQHQRLEDQETFAHMHDRMLFLLGNLSGSKVEVKVKNGTVFEGILQGATTDGDLGVSLIMARKLYDPTETTDVAKTNVHPLLPSLLILSKDLVEINATNVDLTAGEQVRAEKDSFKTDADISNRDYKERELHKWNPDVGDGEVLEALEDITENHSGSWDQFAANEKLFGLKTDFDEEIYTTRLDRSAPDFKDREKWAIEKANEIQKSTTNNPHLLEERNMAVPNDSGMDEEDRYGAVIRDPNVYVPPAMRKQPAQQKTSFTNLPPDSPLHKLTTAAAEKQAPKRIEAEIANTFRKFAMLEKDKLQAKRQALHKKEQSDRLADLVKFHQTFELKVPVPPDLLPLLAKGKKSPASTSSDEKPTSPSNSHTSASEKPKDDKKPPAKPSNFKFNIKASEFKPNPSAAAFVPGAKPTGSVTSEENSRNVKKFAAGEHVTMDDVFKVSFAKGKQKQASTIAPTWPFGNHPYRHQFNHQSQYAEDIYTGYPAPGYGYNYQIRYQYVPGMAHMPVPQQGVPYMNPQFVPPMPGAPIPPGAPPNVAYSPQMANGSPRYSSPQRSHMPPPNGAPPVYPFQGTSVPVRYTPDMMTPPTSTPVMMHERPIMVEPNSPYPPAMPPTNNGSPPPQTDSPADS
ncbi:hypothetical protein DM01DRAFT_1370840 [Hesseltinella vesiculosa]|uniref:LsmAD domain-containing protein n=1 Tax=Hesseltinella vesiculosa TaxID=101127 RepID=A0A1X2GRZ8_9FUNG|nr:hypothetical protein DM01DRAFT_1370840 [Hesseltinella vesiculosa]